MLNPVGEGEGDWSDSLHVVAWKFLKISCFFFSFCRPVVGTSDPQSPTSGPLILPVFGKIEEIVFTHFANFEHSRRFSRLHLVDFGKEVFRFLDNSVSIAVFSAEANLIFKTKRCLSMQECIHEGLSRVCWDLPHMPAFSCSSRHFTHFAIYRIIFGVGNFSRGFFVCSERKCSIFVSVLFCFYLLL